MNVRGLWCLLPGVAIAVTACGGESGGPAPTLSIEKFAGDSQGIAVSTASAPMQVRVLDDANVPVAGVAVAFAVTSGTGALSSTVDTSDGSGLAATTFTGSTTAGLRKVRAQITGSQVVFDLVVAPGSPAGVLMSAGNEQAANAGTALAIQLAARVVDGFGNSIAGTFVRWGIVNGSGALSADSSLTDAGGIAKVTRTLGPGAGGQVVRATVAGLADTIRFHATAKKAISVVAGGNNEPVKCMSDLWVQGGYGYTGTWGNCGGTGARVLKVWDVGTGVSLVDSVFAGLGTVSDNEVSPDGTLLLATAEGGGAANGLYLYSLVDPAHPILVDSQQVSTGLHTGTFADIGGQRYVFAAKDPGSPALMVFRIQLDSADKIVQVASVAQPANYGIHDQYIRDGLAFVSDWNTGMRIYDVGDGRLGGSPATPMLIGTIVTASQGLSCNCVHNAWWYHDAEGGKRYLFIGQEGPSDFTTASGDIHVVDVSNMAAPVEVAFFHIPGAGVHNFWMDESRGILYAAYYNAGVVALDVTGTLSGNLASREIARLQPGGAGNTFTWGVMLANESLWASDMFSGFWKLSVP